MNNTASLSVEKSIRLLDLAIGYGGVDILRGVNLEITAGEIIALVGASGCGKSTLLRAIAGLIPPKAGNIELHKSHRRSHDIAYVFQDATLLPWRNVIDNIRLPLELSARASGQRAEDRQQQIAKSLDALESVELGRDCGSQMPHELSGGMKMRVSLARALVTNPSILLLDEPFAALDEMLRAKMNQLVLTLHARHRSTIVFVTHNIGDALILSHRIVILGQKRICEVIDNPLGYPRGDAIQSTSEFAVAYGRVRDALLRVSL